MTSEPGRRHGPVAVWSGNTAGKVRLSRGGNRHIDCALNMIAVTNGWITSASTTPLFVISPINATQQAILSLSPTGLAGNAFPTNGVSIPMTGCSITPWRAGSQY